MKPRNSGKSSLNSQNHIFSDVNLFLNNNNISTRKKIIEKLDELHESFYTDSSSSSRCNIETRNLNK